tara:strand:- start:1064 stop:2443 length:1380 start_codon:yes stop_codon:yes gene_type:complete
MFKNSLYYTFEKLGPKVFSIIVLPVILRLVKPELWAEITLLLGIQLLLSYFFTRGDERSLLKYSSNESLIYISIGNLIRYCLVGIIIFEALGYILKVLPFSLEYGLPFRFMFLSTVLVAANKLLLAKLRSEEKSKEIFYSSFVDSLLIQIFQLILIALVVRYDGFDSRVIVTAFFFSQLIGNIIKFLYFKIKLTLKFRKIVFSFKSKQQREVINFSNISFLILISNYLLSWQDRYFVEYLFGFKQLGVYSVTTRLSNLGMVFMSSLLITAYSKYWPKDSNIRSGTNIENATKDIFQISALTFSIIMLITATVGDYVLPVAYLESIRLIGYSGIVVFLQTYVLILTIDYGRQSKLSKVLMFNTLAAGTQFILYLSLNITRLEEMFVIQMFSMMLFVFIFFGRREIVKYYKSNIILFLLLSSSFYIVNLIFLYDQILFRVLGFVISMVYSFLLLNKWVKVE